MDEKTRKTIPASWGQDCVNMNNCDLKGGCNPNCCATKEDCPYGFAGQTCGEKDGKNNGYCQTNNSCDWRSDYNRNNITPTPPPAGDPCGKMGGRYYQECCAQGFEQHVCQVGDNWFCDYGNGKFNVPCQSKSNIGCIFPNSKCQGSKREELPPEKFTPTPAPSSGCRGKSSNQLCKSPCVYYASCQTCELSDKGLDEVCPGHPCSYWGERDCKITTNCEWDGLKCVDKTSASSLCSTKNNTSDTSCKSIAGCEWYGSCKACRPRGTKNDVACPSISCANWGGGIDRYYARLTCENTNKCIWNGSACVDKTSPLPPSTPGGIPHLTGATGRCHIPGRGDYQCPSNAIIGSTNNTLFVECPTSGTECVYKCVNMNAGNVTIQQDKCWSDQPNEYKGIITNFGNKDEFVVTVVNKLSSSIKIAYINVSRYSFGHGIRGTTLPQIQPNITIKPDGFANFMISGGECGAVSVLEGNRLVTIEYYKEGDRTLYVAPELRVGCSDTPVVIIK
jgi:hypothetical protein